MELRKTDRFVADGHQRWSAAREEKVRAAVLGKVVVEKNQIGFFGKIQLWFKTEVAVLRGQKAGGKASPKILW